MNDARRIAKLEAQVAALRSRLAARTDQLLLLLLQIDDLKRAVAPVPMPAPVPMLQDCDSKLSKWLSNTPHARQHAIEAAHGIKKERHGNSTE